MKSIVIVFSLFLISCASSNMVGLSLTQDEIDAAVDSPLLYAKAVFNQFCENGKQIREFKFTARWPLGSCSGHILNEAEILHQKFIDGMDKSVIRVFTDALVHKSAMLTLKMEYDEEKLAKYYKDQCGSAYGKPVFDENNNVFFISEYNEEEAKFVYYAEGGFFLGYGILPTEQQLKIMMNPADTSRIQTRPTEWATGFEGKSDYFQTHVSLKKTINPKEVMYEISYDLNDFCQRGKLKEEIISK